MYQRSERGWEVGASVDDPAAGLGKRWWGKDACAEGGIGTRAAEDVELWWLRCRVMNFI